MLPMSRKRKFEGGTLAVIGFMLSPLSWWNDLFINVPLAVGFGWFVSMFYKPAFGVSVVAGYWLTNILGFVLMHIGTRRLLSDDRAVRYTRKDLVKDIAISLIYTLLVIAFIKMKLLQPFADYFSAS